MRPDDFFKLTVGTRLKLFNITFTVFSISLFTEKDGELKFGNYVSLDPGGEPNDWLMICKHCEEA